MSILARAALATLLMSTGGAALAQTTVGPPTSQAPPTPAAAPSTTPPANPPTVQRPEEPVEQTPYPAPPPQQPPAGPVQLAYVPGLRIILTGHKENYFISGVDKGTQVKFQYSAKFDLWPNASRHSAYFGFTQKSFWRLYDPSAPFDESDYNPEVFYGYYKRAGDIAPRPGRLEGFLLNARGGLEHESNGLAGPSSRSWNRVYGYARFGLYAGANNYVTVSPKAWIPVFDLSDNPDITQYLGYGSVTAEYGFNPTERHWYGGGLLGAVVQKGWHEDRYGVEAYAQWRPGYEGKYLRWFKFTPYLYAQLFTGYGESLLQYNREVTAVRFGISMEDKVNWMTVVKRPPAR